MRNTSLAILAHLAFGAFANDTVAESRAMDFLVCTISDSKAFAATDYIESLCAKVAESMDARIMTREQMDSAVSASGSSGNPARYHLVDAQITSPNAISYTYTFGSADEWRDGREKTFGDLHVEVADAGLNDSVADLIADMARRLSK